MTNYTDIIGKRAQEINYGYSSGEICNRDGCKAIIQEYDKEGCCYCHINPPCSYCTTSSSYCDSCKWDGKEEQDECIETYVKSNEESSSLEFERYNEKDKLFDKAYSGLIPANALEIRRYSHTNFTMMVKGVFPNGTETPDTILPKIRGTFGGRFTKFNEYRFEYIAYTD